MARRRTHYEALGVRKTAKTDEIRKAFRQKAKQHHPDTAGHEDARLFHEAQTAYEILRDPGTRREYDRDLATGGAGNSRAYSPAGSAGGTFTDADRVLWELWEAFFGPDADASPGEYGYRRTEKRDPLSYTVRLSETEAREGTRVPLPHDARKKLYADIPAGVVDGQTISTEITDLFGTREIQLKVRIVD